VTGFITPAKQSSHLLNSSTSFAGAITPVTLKFKSSHLLNFSTSFAGAMTPVTRDGTSKSCGGVEQMPDLNLGVTGVMAPAKLVEEFNK
jgi:hypothetical protein